jgi:hypothetical protein
MTGQHLELKLELELRLVLVLVSESTHSVLAQLEDHVDVIGVFEAVFEADDVWVRQHLVQLDLRPELTCVSG